MERRWVGGDVRVQDAKGTGRRADGEEVGVSRAEGGNVREGDEFMHTRQGMQAHAVVVGVGVEEGDDR